jgi:hypothetical protein
MKNHFNSLLLLPTILLLFCSKSKEVAPDPSLSVASASLMVKGNSYKFSIVSALNQANGTMIISANEPNSQQAFSIFLKGAAAGTIDFKAEGTLVNVIVSATEGYSNNFTPACGVKIESSNGTINISSLTWPSETGPFPKKLGNIKGTFSGQLPVERRVPEFLCSNGYTKSTVKIEFVDVSGTFDCPLTRL